MQKKKVIKSDYEKPIQCACHNLKTRVLGAFFHNFSSDTLSGFMFAFRKQCQDRSVATCQTAGVDNSNVVATHTE